MLSILWFTIFASCQPPFKGMLPISLADQSGFIEFVEALDNCFIVPSRNTIKKAILTEFPVLVTDKIKQELKEISHPTMLLDIWTDATMRSFIGYVCQGIDSSWQMKTIPIGFRVLLDRHTSMCVRNSSSDDDLF